LIIDLPRESQTRRPRPRWLTWAAINRRMAFEARAQTTDNNAERIVGRYSSDGSRPRKNQRRR
jgi:hypothetical protein